MNSFIISQCRNIRLMVSVFNTAVIEAAKKDDGTISVEEEETIKKLQKASLRYLKDINKIVGASR